MKQYKITIGGQEHVVQLSDDDAKRYPDAKEFSEGDSTAPVTNQAGTATKSRHVRDK